jgi:hypothetical protein
VIPVLQGIAWQGLLGRPEQGRRLQRRQLRLPPPQDLEAFIDDHLGQPCTESRTIADCGLALPGFEKGLLAHVLRGCGIPQHAIGQSEQQTSTPADLLSQAGSPFSFMSRLPIRHTQSFPKSSPYKMHKVRNFSIFRSRHIHASHAKNLKTICYVMFPVVVQSFWADCHPHAHMKGNIRRLVFRSSACILSRFL